MCIQVRRIHGKLIHRCDVTWHAWAMIIYVFTPDWIMTTVQWSHTSHYHLLTSRELHPPTLHWPEKLVNNYRSVTPDASLNILPRFYSCIHQILWSKVIILYLFPQNRTLTLALQVSCSTVWYSEKVLLRSFDFLRI